MRQVLSAAAAPKAAPSALSASAAATSQGAAGRRSGDRLRREPSEEESRTMAKGASQDFGKMTIEELEAAIQEAAATLEQKRQEKEDQIIAQVRELTAQIGKTPEELFGRRGKTVMRVAGPAEAPKYRHPGDPSLTWSGRGKRPQWLTDELAAGKTLQDLTA
jgi:DNA-binding protein H-NS